MRALQPVDFYCERVIAGFGAEPLNMVTALVFIGVGLWFLRRGSAVARVPSVALMLVGIAAFLFHGFGQLWGLWADLAANLAFNAALGWALARGFLRCTAPRSVLAGVVLAAVMHFAGPLSASLMPGLAPFAGYAVLIAALVTVSHAHFRFLTAAAAILTVGLVLRVNDGAACAQWPYGTHMIWHLLFAATMALVLAALSRQPDA